MSDILMNSQRHAEQITELVGTELPPKSACICRVRDGELMGGAVYYNLFGTTSISAHIAGCQPNWLSRRLLRLMFAYPFLKLRVDRIFGFVAEDNPRAVRFNRHLGFLVTNKIPGMYKNDTTCIVMQMEREDCRFLDLEPRFMTSLRHSRVAGHG